MGEVFKLKPPEPTLVLNLSYRILTSAEAQVLAKGQTFILKPLNIDRSNLHEGVQDFDRRIKLTYFFRNSKTEKNLFR